MNMTDQDVSDKLPKERQLAIELLNTKGNRLVSPLKINTQNFNISDCYADRTQEVQLTPRKNENNDSTQTDGYNFEPKEISGRSTDFTGETATDSKFGNFDIKEFITPDLDEIFATSICEDVRKMGRALGRLSSTRDSLQSLPRTADIDVSPVPSSSTSIAADWNERGYNKDWLADAVNAPQLDFDAEFQSSGEALSKIIHDQHDWEKEFADIPSISATAKPTTSDDLFKMPDIPPKAKNIRDKLKNHTDFGDFSGYLEVVNETERFLEESRRNFSIGNFFLKNSNDLGEMCPDKSPPKRNAVPLVDTLTEYSWLKETSEMDDSKGITEKRKTKDHENKENTNPNNLSVSTILKAYKALTLNDTPHTVLKKFNAAKQSKQSGQNQNEHNDILSSTILSNQGINNPFETESVAALDETAPKSPEPCCSPQVQKKNTFSMDSCDDSGKGRTLSSYNAANQPTTPRNTQKHSKHDHISGSPCSVASSLERTDDIDRALLSVGHSGKFSLPAYPVSVNRTPSQCSTSSEYRPTDRNAKFPLKTSCMELSWNCVKLQERVSKKVTIKNICDKHVSVMVTISGPGFQCSIIGKQKLEKYECRSFTIEFCPTVTGPAEGCLSFALINTSQEFVRNINLFGYGGKSNVRVRGLEIPPSGDKYLCMGTMRDLGHSMEQYIEIGNRGDIDAFAIVAHEAGSKAFNVSFIPSNLIISPQRLRLPSKRCGSIKISFTPTREEARYICDQPQDVVVIAKVSVIYGDWPTRDRLKRVSQKVTEKNSIVEKICQPFKNERTSSSGEKFLDDAWKIVQECTNTFQHMEFLLTLNKSSDETINLTQAIGEQSILFKSMLSDEMRIHRGDTEIFPLKVTPENIYFNSLSEKVEMKIKNISGNMETFEIGQEFKTFIFDPQEGQIGPDEEIVVDIRLAHRGPSPDSKFSIFVAHGKITIPVNVSSFLMQ
ncbi:uncharacterized protein LOC134829790 isoform X2 [Culicoides brevitarsis]|uniref:uncharacterized protein LOC134829790 isoform X2 n=1 Tax=Culicoides brevitarsis TaxID=469753 RepID=UPI00307B1C18